MIKIAIACQKGGVGKTATALALFHHLRLAGERVLGVDLDAQMDFTLALPGMEESVEGKDVASLLLGKSSLAECARPFSDIDKPGENAAVLPGSAAAAALDVLLTGSNRQSLLAAALRPFEDAFDYAILDCAPGLGVLSLSGLVAADWVVVPAQADMFGLQALKQFSETLKAVRERWNPGLRVAGPLLTRHDSRSVLSKQMEAALRDAAKLIDAEPFPTPIRASVVVQEALATRRALETYAPKSKVNQDYQAFISELMRRIHAH